MPFQFPSRRLSVLASVLAAGLMLAAAGCSGHITPLGPDPAATRPQPRQLRTPIVTEAMLVQQPAPPGSCPAGFTRISAPITSDRCYRKLGTPVTFTSAAVTLVQPRNVPGEPPEPSGMTGLVFNLPAADVATLTAITTTATDSQGAVEISVAGKIWALEMSMAPLTHGQFEIVLPSRNQALQLERTLTSTS
jgi:hypothetical protein